MRITGGEARGRLIKAPPGLSIRPTASKVRQAFFNILSNNLYGARFLDLCAGTGLMGIESLSRGADSLIAVEEHRPSARAIEANLKLLGYEGEVICADVRKALPILAPGSFDIIYADPPYKSELVFDLTHLVEKFELLDEDGVLIIEHLKTIDPDERRAPKAGGDTHEEYAPKCLRGAPGAPPIYNRRLLEVGRGPETQSRQAAGAPGANAPEVAALNKGDAVEANVDEADVAFEHPEKIGSSRRLIRQSVRNYGQTSLSFYGISGPSERVG